MYVCNICNPVYFSGNSFSHSGLIKAKALSSHYAINHCNSIHLAFAKTQTSQATSCFFFHCCWDFTYFKRQGKREKKWGEKHQCAREIHGPVASCTPPTGDLAHNPGRCPDREWNWQPFRSKAGAQPSETTTQNQFTV